MIGTFVANNRKFKWETTNDSRYDGIYVPSTKTIRVNSESFTNPVREDYIGRILGEELFHAYQDLQNTLSTAKDGTGVPNKEFEARLFLDLMNYNSEPPPFNVFDNMMEQTYDPELDIWFKNITNNKTQFPQSYSTMQSKYFYYMEKFKDLNRGNVYDKPIDYNKGPQALLNLIQVSQCKN